MRARGLEITRGALDRGLDLGGGLSAAARFEQQADAKFGDQNFKTSIALIELYRASAFDAAT